MTLEVIIGLSVLRQDERLMTENDINVKNKKCQMSEEINLITVLPINSCNETEIDIDPSVYLSFKDEVQDLVLNYKQCKNKSTNVKLKICMKIISSRVPSTP